MGSDWEDLMSGVFGSGGKLNFAGAEGRDRAKQAQDALAQAQKELEATLERQRSAKTAADAVSGEQLLKNSAALDEQLKRQAREISEMGRDLTHNMQQAGRISDRTAFFLLGELVEYGPTKELFTTPGDKRTEDYITGRFG